MRTIQIPTPPRDEDLKRVHVKTSNSNEKVELSVALAKAQGYITFTVDDRGYVDSITDLTGEPTCPALGLRPLWIPQAQ